MAFRLGVLRLNPSNFWAMTPRELAAAARGAGAGRAAATAPEADVLAALMQAFPDRGFTTRARANEGR